MKKSRLKSAAVAAAGALALGAVIGAPGVQAAEGNKSLASVLDVGNASFDRSSGNYDILTKAVEAVLEAKPDSPVALLADGDTALTVFAPTDKAFKNLASALAGHKITSESDAFDAVAGLGIDTVETVLLYHVIPGSTITSADALASNGAVLATADEGKNTKVLVSDAPSIRLRDYAPKFKNAKVILDAVDINEGNKQIAHGVDAVMLPFAP
ncbi:MAG TPA: fasciclin domain-containing protein [Candidatus Nanopelagicales bacterium]|nr:fasciclin domain-containing protein [Candidatus Nanopelagicales bacterium]